MGMTFFDRVTCTALKNCCDGNGKFGFSLSDETQVLLEANQCRNNQVLA